MGVKTSLAAITLTNTEVQAGFTVGQDSVGMLENAIATAATLAEQLQFVVNAIPSGSNSTAIQAVITSLS